MSHLSPADASLARNARVPFGLTALPSRVQRHRRIRLLASVVLVLSCGGVAADDPGWSPLQREVAQSERAFAQTMADRDHAAFAGFLAEDAVFFAGTGVLRGKQQVVEGWKPLYESPVAPFSWEPDQVEVLESGTLAHSSGPVRGPDGNATGRFNSIWRREPAGAWRIVFDKGSDPCPP